jgi:predicted aspartyl protease
MMRGNGSKQVGIWLIGLVIIMQLAGCTTFRILSLVRSGEMVPLDKPAEAIQFETKGHLILVKVKINQAPQEYNFILDTGAFSVVNQTLANELKLEKMEEVQAEGLGGSGKAYLTRLPSLTAGGVTVKGCAVAIMDLNNVETISGIKIDGLLGSNFLRHFVVTIDYEQRKLVLATETNFPPKDAEPVAIPFQQEMTVGFAPKIKILGDNDFPLRGIIDTGTLHTMVDLKLYEKKKELFSAARKVQGQIGGGAFKLADKAMLLQIKRLRVGSMVLEAVPTIGFDFGRKLSTDLLIGKDILQRYVFTIDYLKNQLFLVPRGQEKASCGQLSIGAAFKKDEKNRTIVSGIIEASPADKSGLAVGDEILEVNGKPSQDYSIIDLIELANDDQEIELQMTVKEQAGMKKIVLKKVDLFL